MTDKNVLLHRHLFSLLFSIALKSVSDVGKRVVDEVASFADTVLQLAERQDELAVAKNDLERAVQQVPNQQGLISCKFCPTCNNFCSFFWEIFC